MRHATAMTAAALMVLLACLGLTGTGDAQVPGAVQIQGTIQSADCNSGRLTLATASGDDTFQATDQTTAYVNGKSVSFCDLQSYRGASATAVLVPTGNAFDLSQVNVTAQSASGSKLSPVAIGVGALLLGGLIGYVIGHKNGVAQGQQEPVYYQGPSYYQAPAYYQPAPAYYQPAPAYYPYGYAPRYLPANYPYNRPYSYQGHRYYRCTSGRWNVDRACNGPER